MHLAGAIQASLTAAGLTSLSPGWQIVAGANLLPPIPGSPALFGNTVAQALGNLLRSYYDFGRQNWTWAQSAGAAAANGGLVKGNINAVACGSFNQNFKWLAENALGIMGITNSQETDTFLTIPGATCIDSKWIGNVRTAKESFAQLKCFKFTGHYWVTHGGINYDVCYNNTFNDVSEIIWTKLSIVTDPKLAGKGGLLPNQLFKLEKPLPTGDYLAQIQQNGPNNWPSWQIITEEELKNLA